MNCRSPPGKRPLAFGMMKPASLSTLLWALATPTAAKAKQTAAARQTLFLRFRVFWGCFIGDYCFELLSVLRVRFTKNHNSHSRSQAKQKNSQTLLLCHFRINIWHASCSRRKMVDCPRGQRGYSSVATRREAKPAQIPWAKATRPSVHRSAMTCGRLRPFREADGSAGAAWNVASSSPCRARGVSGRCQPPCPRLPDVQGGIPPALT